MKTKRKILSLTISALLMTGVASYTLPGYAKDDSGSKKTNTETKADRGSKKTDTETKADSGSKKADSGTKADSGSKKTETETLHVISGCTGSYLDTLLTKVESYYEPITVADTALDDESIVTAMSQCLDKGDSSDSGKSDKVDSGTPKSDSNKRSAAGDTTSKQKITICHVPPGNPEKKHTIHIAFSAWAAHKAHTNTNTIGEPLADYLGSCGSTASGGKGGGHDSVSDSGNHHRIRGCQNKDSGHKADSSDSSKHGLSDSDKDDTNKNYHKKLKDADSGHDTAHNIKDPVVVSDSSLDDAEVWTEFKKCAKDSSDSKKIDSSKAGKQKGDSGHKQHILKSCGDAQDQKVKDAIAKYKEKDSTKAKDIILTETSYTDVSIKQAVDNCVDATKGGGTDTTTTPTTPTTTSSSSGASGRLNLREETSPK
ncbi:MAG: hypothetical protein ACXWT4_02035 [Methylobacter sp.]